LHWNVQALAAQLAVPPGGLTQVLPQAPQLARFVFKSTHDPLHSASPAGQSSLQVPEAHTWPTAQGALQRPQFFGSVANATQAVPHG